MNPTELRTAWRNVRRAVGSNPSDQFSLSDLGQLLTPELLTAVESAIYNDVPSPPADGAIDVRIPPGFTGAIIWTGSSIHMLSDAAQGQGPRTVWLSDLTPIERAVTVLRMRLWADALEVTHLDGA